MAGPDYSSDAPVASREGDLFDRWPFAERVAHVLRDRREATSLVVGLYGGWGEGKTTTLNFIEEALAGAEGVVVVRFNPWRFGDEPTLVRRFFESLAGAVEGRLTTKREDFASAAATYAGALSLGAFGVTLDPKKAAETFAEVDLDTLKQRLSDVLCEAGLRVVVRIDDIDRLDKDEVQAVFRLVKLSADFEHVAYVLALDPDMVAAALQERYGPGRPRAGYDFLEKIVTVPLQLPPARAQALYGLCVGAVTEALELSGARLDDEGRRFAEAFQSGLLPAMRTPRMAKRYGNAIRFALPILAGEVDASDQLLIEGMRVVYPSLYEHVRSHPGVYLRDGIGSYLGGGDESKERQRRKEEIQAIIQREAPEHPEAALALVTHLFPRAVGGRGYGNPSRDQRASSRWYVERYFTYALSGDDVRDRDFNEAMERAEAGDAVGCATRLRALLRDATQERLAEMLRTRASAQSRASAPLRGAESLARAISAVSDGFASHRIAFGFSGESFLSKDALDLIETISDVARRDAVLADVVRTSSSLTFAMHMRGWASPVEDGKGVGFASVELDHTLVAILADRIALDAQAEAPHLSERGQASWLYQTWADGHNGVEVQAYLRRRLKDDPHEVDALLRALTPHGVTGASDPFPIGFGPQEYESILPYVDPADVYDALQTVYDQDVLDAGYLNIDYVGSDTDGYRGVTTGEALARLFVVAHRRTIESEDGG